MDEWLQWSELIAYLTASVAAFIYICDTSYIYLSGMKKYLRRKNKEAQSVKEEYIANSLSNSLQTTPSGSMIFTTQAQLSHPRYGSRNSSVHRSLAQSSPTPIEQPDDFMENSLTLERNVSNPLYDKRPEKVDFVSLYCSDSSATTPDGSPPPLGDGTHNRMARHKQTNNRITSKNTISPSSNSKGDSYF